MTELQTGRLQLWPYTADVSAIWLPETYWGRGFNALALGDFAEARRLAEQALALSEQLGLGLGPGFASHLLAWAWLNLGDYERADQAARRFLGIASAFGEGLMTAMALAVLGRTQFRLGRYDEARAWWRRGLALARRTGLHGNVAACLVGLGDIELARGNLAAARRLYEQRLEMAGQSPPAGRPSAVASQSVLAALIGLGRVALREGHPHEARERFQQVLSAAGCQAATTAEAIVYTAETLLQQGELARPAELCGFLLAWPGAPQHVKDETRMLLAALEARLTSDELAAAIERGQVRRPEEVLAQIIPLCDNYSPAAGQEAIS
ncbi:MAG: tetratricopeptide repeat protein [Anaerolineae bacterium]